MGGPQPIKLFQKVPGDTIFTEATKTFEKELTRDQRKAAIQSSNCRAKQPGGASKKTA
jgi:hypothetical protein